MGGVFSSKKPKKKRKVSSADRAVLDLKNARDRLRKYQTKLEAENATLTRQAAALLRAGKKDRAVLTLKFRRFREAKIADADAQLLRLEEMVNTIEWETQQAAVLASLKQGTDALNKIHSEMTVEAVEDLLDDSREAQDTANRISALLAGEIDEAGLEDELALLDDVAVDQFPVAPDTALPQVAAREEVEAERVAVAA